MLELISSLPSMIHPASNMLLNLNFRSSDKIDRWPRSFVWPMNCDAAWPNVESSQVIESTAVAMGPWPSKQQLSAEFYYGGEILIQFYSLDCCSKEENCFAVCKSSFCSGRQRTFFYTNSQVLCTLLIYFPLLFLL